MAILRGWRHGRVRRQRKAVAGLTQTVVAQRRGKPPPHVAKYEGGDRRLDVLEYLDVAEAIAGDRLEALRQLVAK
jgi:hypothetical protein